MECYSSKRSIHCSAKRDIPNPDTIKLGIEGESLLQTNLGTSGFPKEMILSINWCDDRKHGNYGTQKYNM